MFKFFNKDKDKEDLTIQESVNKSTEEKSDPIIIDSIEAIKEYKIPVVRNILYKGYVLNAFTTDEGLYFPDIITFDGVSQVLYRLIPIELIKDCAKDKEIVEIIKTGVDENVCEDADSESE